MTIPLTALSIFEQHQKALEFHWVEGQSYAKRPIEAVQLDTSRNALIGNLNLIRPNLIQVLGQAELPHRAPICHVFEEGELQLWRTPGGVPDVCGGDGSQAG